MNVYIHIYKLYHICIPYIICTYTYAYMHVLHTLTCAYTYTKSIMPRLVGKN